MRAMSAAAVVLALCTVWEGALEAQRAQQPSAASEQSTGRSTDRASERATDPSAEPGPDLTANRPGFAESPDVLARGVIQLELGVVETSDSGGHTIAVPQPVLRVGIGHRVELQAGGQGFFLQSSTAASGHTRVSGASDDFVGAKVTWLTEEANRMNVSLLGTVTFPVGGTGFSSNSVDPTGAIAWSRSLPHAFSTGGTVSLTATTDARGRLAQGALSLSLSRTWPGRWSTFGEVYGSTPDTHEGRTGWLVDGGVSHLIGSHFQVDLSAGHGLNAAAPAWFVGAGLALRLTDGHARTPRRNAEIGKQGTSHE